MAQGLAERQAKPSPFAPWQDSGTALVALVAGRRGRIKQALLIVLLGLIALRIALPYIIVAVVNQRLARPGPVEGHIGGVSLSLVRGVYQVDDLEIRSGQSASNSEPILSIARLEFAIFWLPLLNGHLHGAITITRPILSVIPAPGPKEPHPPWTNADWRKMVTGLTRLEIDHVTIVDGRIRYLDPMRQVHTEIGSIGGSLTDLILPTGYDRPAVFDVTGETLGHGHLHIHGTATAHPDKPQMSMQASLEQVNLPELSPVSRQYDGLVFQAGTFSGFLELTLDGQQLHGSFKPIFTDLEITSYQKEHGSLAAKLFWKVAVPIATDILKNTQKNQQAAIVPIVGTVNDAKTDVWTIVMTSLGNAFITAIIPGFSGMDKISSP